MKRMKTKYLHEGKYVAEVEVELIDTPESWSPCLSLEEAYKLDDIRESLRKGDIESASQHARVYVLTPVAM